MNNKKLLLWENVNVPIVIAQNVIAKIVKKANVLVINANVQNVNVDNF